METTVNGFRDKPGPEKVKFFAPKLVDVLVIMRVSFLWKKGYNIRKPVWKSFGIAVVYNGSVDEGEVDLLVVGVEGHGPGVLEVDGVRQEEDEVGVDGVCNSIPKVWSRSVSRFRIPNAIYLYQFGTRSK